MTVNFTGGATIIYKAPKNFEKYVNIKGAKEVGKFPQYMWHNKYTENYTRGQKMYTHDALDCSALVINRTMVHLAPEYRERNLMDKIGDFVKSEFDKKGDVTAVLVGGRENVSQSQGLYCDTANVLEKEGADFTMICGKKPQIIPNASGIPQEKYGTDSLCKAARGDIYAFTQNRNPELEQFVKANPNPTSEEIKNMLGQFYSDVEVSPLHTFKIDA